MAINKIINVNDGSGREFTENTVAELKFDVTPQLGSFNTVTSDGIFKAISGASGEVPAVNPGDAGKVLTAGFDGDTPTVSWEEPQGTEYTAGDGIEINAQNAVSVNVGTGLSINSGTPVDMTLKAIKRNGTYWSIGQLTAQAVAAIKGNASLKFTVLDEYKLGADPYEQQYSFDEARIVIVPQLSGVPGYPIKSDAYSIMSSTNIRSAFVAGSTSEWPYVMPANTQVTVDFSNPTVGSDTSWSAVEANPTGYMLAITKFDSSSSHVFGECARLSASGSDPEQKDVATLEYTVPGDNSLEVSNPVPNYTTSEDGKVLGVVDNSGTAELQWVAPATVDQTYDASSTNAQSGVAVAEAIGGVLPSITGQASKVLAVNSGATGLEWVSAGGGGGDTIAPYTLRFKFLDTSFDPSVSITGTYGTWTRVSSDPNIWDWTNESWSWQNCFNYKSFSAEGSALIGSGDLSGVTSMGGMFKLVSDLAYVKMGNFGATCNFEEMFSQARRGLSYVELGEPGDICYGNMQSMFKQNTYTLNYGLQVIFNGTLAATNMRDFAQFNVGLVEAPRITVSLFRHECTDFTWAFQDCKNLKIVPQYTTGTDSVSWYQAFSGCKSLVAAPDLDLTYATNTAEMFSGCESLAYVPDYDVSSATVYGMFSGCRSLTKIPNLTGLEGKSSLDRLFEDCYGIQTGADTLYQQLSTQATPPTSTTDTFKNCGAATVTGSAALATIPASWGGTGA